MIDNYVVIKLLAGSNIEDAVKRLQEFKKKGILAKCKFNESMLYSDNITLDSAYVSVTGKHYDEVLLEQKQWKENYDREQQEWKNNLPVKIAEWIEKGKEILDPDMLEEWNEIVPIRARDLYHGVELDASLDIIKALNNNESFENVAKIIDEQGHSGMSHGLVCALVQRFSKRGSNFVAILK